MDAGQDILSLGRRLGVWTTGGWPTGGGVAGRVWDSTYWSGVIRWGGGRVAESQFPRASVCVYVCVRQCV